MFSQSMSWWIMPGHVCQGLLFQYFPVFKTHPASSEEKNKPPKQFLTQLFHCGSSLFSSSSFIPGSATCLFPYMFLLKVLILLSVYSLVAAVVQYNVQRIWSNCRQMTFREVKNWLGGKENWDEDETGEQRRGGQCKAWGEMWKSSRLSCRQSV